jgi:ADP-ribose pyrophosphatase YjhB (NUDIX family)
MAEYMFCPHCGTTLGEIVEEGNTFKHCYGCKKFTHYDNPKGVVNALIPLDGGLVLILRAVNPRAGKHALPGGYINKGEGPRQAVVREILEETGLIVEVVRPLDELPVPHVNQFLCFYLVKVVGGQLKAGSDAGEVAVHKLDALPAEIAFPLHDQVIKAWIAGNAKVQEKWYRRWWRAVSSILK